MKPKRIPAEWQEYFKDVWSDGSRVVMTSVGPRRDLVRVWQCRMCGLALTPNTAGANSHLVKHCRAIERARAKQ
jgi:hypothetical protein